MSIESSGEEVAAVAQDLISILLQWLLGWVTA